MSAIEILFVLFAFVVWEPEIVGIPTISWRVVAIGALVLVLVVGKLAVVMVAGIVILAVRIDESGSIGTRVRATVTASHARVRLFVSIASIKLGSKGAIVAIGEATVSTVAWTAAISISRIIGVPAASTTTARTAWTIRLIAVILEITIVVRATGYAEPFQPRPGLVIPFTIKRPTVSRRPRFCARSASWGLRCVFAIIPSWRSGIGSARQGMLAACILYQSIGQEGGDLILGHIMVVQTPYLTCRSVGIVDKTLQDSSRQDRIHVLQQAGGVVQDLMSLHQMKASPPRDLRVVCRLSYNPDGGQDRFCVGVSHLLAPLRH